MQNCYSFKCGRIRAVLFILPYCQPDYLSARLFGALRFQPTSQYNGWFSLKLRPTGIPQLALTLTQGFPTVALGPSKGQMSIEINTGTFLSQDWNF